MHKLEPDPATALVVLRIFTVYVDGMSDEAIALRLNHDGIPCPSARDAARNPHRTKKAWQASAVRAILLNPRYTGHEVWNKQRKEERLLDIDDVTLGHRTTMTHNPSAEWIWSNEPAHEPLITKELFEAAQRARRQRARAYQRQERPNRRSSQRAYVLRGRVKCTLCGRKMQPSPMRVQRTESSPLPRARSSAHHQPARRHHLPGTRHMDRPRLRPRAAHRHHHRTQPGQRRGKRRAAPDPEQVQARQVIKECERRLARYQAALDSGADPAVVTRWINDAQRDREAAQKKLDALPTVTRRKEPPLTADQVREITDRLGDIAQRIQAADAEKKEPLYEALGITIAYDKATRTATVRSRPSIPYRYKECPRAELTADDTVAVAQGRLVVQDPRRSNDQGAPQYLTGGGR
ncbi:recombinase family protein [Streptomyces sp. NPDC001307]|uniref:recombinase family protein n=1 Tax=Streptomyces sp. NPDC001307 TaxID=3364560 RepID=UPI00369C67CD